MDSEAVTLANVEIGEGGTVTSCRRSEAGRESRIRAMVVLESMDSAFLGRFLECWRFCFCWR